MIKVILFVFKHLHSIVEVNIFDLKGALVHFAKMSMSELITVLKKKQYRDYTVKLTFTLKL